MANSKRLFDICLFHAVLHVCFLQSVYSTSKVSNQYIIRDNHTEKDFTDSQIQKGLRSSLAVGTDAYPDYEKTLVLKVSKDKFTGDFTTVQAAIDSVPMHNTQLILIHVKPGIYREKVSIAAEKPFIILSGSGANNTVITWNDSAKSSGGTYESATFSVYASDFIATDITIQNSYGPGAQAVALRTLGDRSAFYRCKILGYQDTLLDESGNHYFHDCFIEGATDFICGDGNSLYEKCHIHAIPEKTGAITAQRRSSALDDTGFTFVNCRITGKGLIYLGRAWGRYSRVVFAYTRIDDIIIPQGWYNWEDPSREKTVFYGQYNCYGPGANISRRVPWSHNLTPTQAKPFLGFISGQMWIRKMPSLLQRITILTGMKG